MLLFIFECIPVAVVRGATQLHLKLQRNMDLDMSSLPFDCEGLADIMFWV